MRTRFTLRVVPRAGDHVAASGFSRSPIWVLIVILLVLIGLCFVEFLSLFTASSLDLIQRYSVPLTNRVQRSVGRD
jgi:hypothetical protein